MKKLLFLVSLLLVGWAGQAQQFRLSSQGGVSLLNTLNDSTYVVQVLFDADLTGNSFFPTNIQIGHRLFSQREQLYIITSVANANAAQADLTIVETDNAAVDTEGSPTGEVMIFDPGNTEKIPQVPFGSNGAGSNLQAAVVSYNSRISLNSSAVGSGFKYSYVEYRASVDSALINSLILDTIYPSIHVVETDTTTQHLVVQLPVAGNHAGKELRITATRKTDSIDIYLDPAEGYFLFNDQYPYRYYLNNNELLVLYSNGRAWNLSTAYKTPFDWSEQGQLLPNIELDGFLVRSLPTTANDVADGHVTRAFKNKVPFGENLVKRSSRIIHFPFWNNNSGQVVLKTGVGTAPDGTQTLSRAVYNSGNGNIGYLPGNGGSGSTAFNLWEENTEYTLSIWASVELGDSSSIFPILNNSNLSATPQPVNHTDLRRYSWTFTTDAGISPTRAFNLRIGALDSINLWNLQVERGVAASPDIVTGLDSRAFRDSVYVQQMPTAGFLEYSKARRIFSQDEPHEIITKLLAHHEENPNTKGILIDEPITLTAGITIPENTVFKGLKDKSLITLDLNDPNAYGITIGDQTDTYNSGISLRDLRIQAISPAKAAIYALTSLEEEWINISIISEEAEQNLVYGIYEPLFNFRSIQREISNLYISGAQTGWFTTCQSTTRLENVSFRRNINKGIECYGCGFSADNLLFEQIAGPAISAFNAGRIDLHKVRIEDVPNTNLNEDPTFLISGAEQFTVSNSDLGPVHAFNTGNEVLRLDSVGLAIVRAVFMQTIGDGCPISTTANTNVLVWEYNRGVAQTLCADEIDQATVVYEFRAQNGETHIPNLAVENMQSETMYANDLSIDGKSSVLADTISLIGPHNLLRRSNNISQFPYWNENSSSVDLQNGETDPEGGTTATKVIPQGGTYSFSFIPTSGSNYSVFEPSTWYNLSFSGRLYNAADTAYLFPVVNDIIAAYDTAFITTTSYNRYDFAFRTTANVSPTATIQFYTADQDSFLFAYPQLSKGKYPKAYQETTATDEVRATGSVFAGRLSIPDGINISRAYMSVSGGSTSFLSGSPERLDEDTPGTTEDLFSTDDWSLSGSVATYIGTETKTFFAQAEISNALSPTGDATYYLAKNSTVLTPGIARDHVNDDLDTIAVSWVVTMNTNDTLEVQIDAATDGTCNVSAYSLRVEQW